MSIANKEEALAAKIRRKAVNIMMNSLDELASSMAYAPESANARPTMIICRGDLTEEAMAILKAEPKTGTVQIINAPDEGEANIEFKLSDDAHNANLASVFSKNFRDKEGWMKWNSKPLTRTEAEELMSDLKARTKNLWDYRVVKC